MELIQLKRFLAAAESGSLRQAAATLHISQPTLTQSIKSLEVTLGVELFARGARGVSLTRFGEVLVPRARLMLNERDRIARELHEARSADSLQLRVGVAPYFSRQLFPLAALRLVGRHPSLRLQVVEAHTTELLKLVQEGSIELGFCVHNAGIDADPSLEFVETFVERYSVMARVGHPIFRRRKPADRDLAECAWIVHDPHATQGFLVRHFESRGLPAPRAPFSTLSLPLMVALLMKSDCLALMPEDFVWPEVAASRLRRVTGHGISVQGRGGILTRRGAVRSVVAGEFTADLRGVCAATARSAAGSAR